MNKKLELAAKYRENGMNCAQAVALPFCDELGIDKKTVMMGLEGFGAGMGNRNQICGALSGAVFIASLKTSDGNLEKPSSKAKTYSVTGNICEEFKNRCGAINCKDILNNGKPLISCAECVNIGIELAEKA